MVVDWHVASIIVVSKDCEQVCAKLVGRHRNSETRGSNPEMLRTNGISYLEIDSIFVL